MSVLIVGMDMPTVGRILITFPSGRTLEVSADNTQNILGEAKAVPVPSHGDLIDRDALIRSDDLETLYDALRYAPTIIQAEGGET